MRKLQEIKGINILFFAYYKKKKVILLPDKLNITIRIVILCQGKGATSMVRAYNMIYISGSIRRIGF